MDNFTLLTYDESRVILNYLKTHLLTDIISDSSIDDNDSRHLLSALLKLQCKYDIREKEIACMD